ncbi:MAG TPA: hypothetical protein DCY89_00630 [Gammaproteobacteria bacterium]|nr:hypothetical protein [Gammaproteobacteria bacterium]
MHPRPIPARPARDLRPCILAAVSLLFGQAGATFAANATEAVVPAPAPELYFISPRNGDRLPSPVIVRFGLRHMGVAPAGVEFPGTGHHHLIINAPLPPLAAPIPADDHHRHFGKGQTETEISLPPGRHTLQLLLGDHLHRPHAQPVFSEVITIEVTE